MEKHRGKKIHELSLASSKAATFIPPLLLNKLSSFILQLVGAHHICWDSHHTLHLVKWKQIMAIYIYSLYAITSISTRASFGSLATSTKALAG